MPSSYRLVLHAALILLLLGGLTACASRGYQARHLAADLSLLAPAADEREVLAIMGPPDLRRSLAEGGEEWLYLEARQSRMRRSRVVGGWLGHEDYHLAVITLRDGRMTNSTYRALTEAEFRKFDLPAPDERP